jgi:hypothetical protein
LNSFASGAIERAPPRLIGGMERGKREEAAESAKHVNSLTRQRPSRNAGLNACV